MPSRTATRKDSKRPASTTKDVEAFLAALDHPLKREVIALRKMILGADARIAEGIKWNAPSFRTKEDFATFSLRAKDKVQIILHLGAKKRDNTERVKIADPARLLEWLATDRALVTFRDAQDVEAKRAAFVRVIREWLKVA